jgi:hypothetical protein
MSEPLDRTTKTEELLRSLNKCLDEAQRIRRQIHDAQLRFIRPFWPERRKGLPRMPGDEAGPRDRR